ncbi:Arc family DNA-binding protein [Klebsiella aerogenes]|uniref:Arc family DNA-binding protein n=1 Tax=Klebsiella aerogenes TaxID=548 RepID=UPI002FEFA2B7
MSRDPQINIRIPQELKDAVQALAEANKRSVNAELVAAIEFWTAAKGTRAESFIADLTRRVEELENQINKNPA